MARKARIVGKLEYRSGDGPMIPIRPGPCEIEETPLDATVSWDEGGTKGSTAIPLDDLKRHVAEGTIQWDDEATTTP